MNKEQVKKLTFSTARSYIFKIAEKTYLGLGKEQVLSSNNVKYDSKKKIFSVFDQHFYILNYKKIYVLSIGLVSKTLFESLKNIVKEVNFVLLSGFPIEESFPSLGTSDLVICLIGNIEPQNEIEKNILNTLQEQNATEEEVRTVFRHLQKNTQDLKRLLSLSKVVGIKQNEKSFNPFEKTITTNQDTEKVLKKYNVLESNNLHSVSWYSSSLHEATCPYMHQLALWDKKNIEKVFIQAAEELGLATLICENVKTPLKQYNKNFIILNVPKLNYEELKNICAQNYTVAIFGYSLKLNRYAVGVADSYSLKNSESFGFKIEDLEHEGDLLGFLVNTENGFIIEENNTNSGHLFLAVKN